MRIPVVGAIGTIGHAIVAALLGIGGASLRAKRDRDRDRCGA